MKTKTPLIILALAIILALTLPRLGITGCSKSCNVLDYVTSAGALDWGGCDRKPWIVERGWREPALVALWTGDYWSELQEKDCR